MALHGSRYLIILATLLVLFSLSAKAAEKELVLHNINSEKSIYFALGFKLDPPKSLIQKYFKSNPDNNNIFISSSINILEKNSEVDFLVPDSNMGALCQDIENCSYITNNLKPSTIQVLKQKLAESKSTMANLEPVVVLSWSRDFFISSEDDNFIQQQNYIQSTGTSIFNYRKDQKNFFDVVEWKNPGTNLKAGYEATIRKWQDSKEAPYIQVISYKQKEELKNITVRSYATYPVYFALISCEVDISSIHEARTCAFVKDRQGKKTGVWKLDKNEKASLDFLHDIRAREYFLERPSEYGSIAANNPYRVYLVASAFEEDISTRPSHTISLMRNILTNTRHHRIASIDVFNSGYNNFYIYQNQKGISFYVGDYFATDFTGKVINFLSSIATPWAGKALPTGGPYVENMLSYLKKSVEEKIAYVIDRTNPQNALSDDEKSSVLARKQNILEFIKKLDIKQRNNYVPKNLDIHEIKAEMIPTLAFAPSGGGYRAAIGTLGLKNSLSKKKLDPLFSYQAGLSGSTWYLSKFLHLAQTDLVRKGKMRKNDMILSENFYKKLYQDFRQRPQYNSALTNFLSFPAFEKEHDQLMAFFAPMLVKWAYLQDISLVDLMGAGLWYNLFRDSYPFDLKLTNFQTLMKSGEVPFTMMTAVSKTDQMQRDDYLWFEFSPFETGATEYRRFVLTKFFGRHFYDGISVDITPELILPYLMGIWGSAMSAGILEGLRQEVVPKGLQFNAQLPFVSDILDFAEKDYPALYTLATLLTKHDVDKGDISETLKYAIKYLDTAIFSDVGSVNLADINRIKQKLKATEKRINALKLMNKEIDIDELSWLYDEIKPIAAVAYDSQPDRVSILSKKLTTAKKISELQAFSGAIVGNPYYKLPFEDNLLKDLASIELRDGGVDFNIPFPPLLAPARDVDIIVAFDASPDTTEKLKALQNGCLYAQRHNIKRFPVEECLEYFSNPLKKKELIENIYTIIGDPDSLDKITIIYLPMKVMNTAGLDRLGLDSKNYTKHLSYNPHNDYTATMNLRYSPEQVDELAGFSEALGDVAAAAIGEVFKKKFQKRINRAQQR